MSDLPNVHLEVSGDVFRAGGQTQDGIGWDIYAEAEYPTRSRCRVYVGGRQVADISVHAGKNALTNETQAICAALVWSAIRSVRANG